MTTLYVVGAILTEMLLIVAEITTDWQYYLWAFVVAILWSEAVNSRDPSLYPSRTTRILYFLMFLMMFFFFNKSIMILREIELPIPLAPQ
jgi:hypothetical protein